MASKHNTVCCSCVVVSVLLVLCLLPFTNSSDSQGDLLEYALVDKSPDNLGPAVEVEGFHSVRTKRQANPTSGSSGNNVSSTSMVGLPSTTQTMRADTMTTVVVTTTTTNTTTTTTTTKESSVQPTGFSDGTTTPQGNHNSTLETTVIKNNHNYYTSTNIPGASKDHFVVLDNPDTYDSLNSAHRLGGVVKLPFTFRFYGHNITSVTITTGGFLYMSPFVHKFLASTQYTAPLMANFHTAGSNDSNIFFQHVGDEFVVEWQNVTLKDEEDKGYFIFQAKLKIDGTITFVYKKLPVPLSNITSVNHPLKIGLSDAFYNDTRLPLQGIIQRRIIEYHRVVFYPQQVEEGTVIILRPLPTCNVIEDCKTCSVHKNVNFDCEWCSNVGRCSDGIDWYRQDWQKKGCKVSAHADPSLCNLTTTTQPPPTTFTTTTINESGAAHNASQASQTCGNGKCGSSPKNSGVAAAVTVSVLLAVLLIAVGIWVYYAYSHPTSSSGIWLMEHRPSMMRAKLANLKCCGGKTPVSSKYAMETTA